VCADAFGDRIDARLAPERDRHAASALERCPVEF
jgi:hypothetical protein